MKTAMTHAKKVPKNEVVFTPFADACLPGITRGLIISLCKENNIHLIEKNISVTELYNADQVFTTGTMGEIAIVKEIDGRVIKNNDRLLNIIKTKFRLLTQIM